MATQPWSWTPGIQLQPLTESPTGNLPRADGDSTAIVEMLGTPEGLRARWARPPQLQVLVAVMDYKAGDNVAYSATAERMTEQEIQELVADLTSGLQMLTADTFPAFARVEQRVLEAGATAAVSEPNTIVVGRFNGVRRTLGTLGAGGRNTRADGTIRAGAIILDSEFDRTNGKRRLLRTHELGHALGYNHVRARESIMNPRIGSGPTAFDREAVLLAFRRPLSATAAR